MGYRNWKSVSQNCQEQVLRNLRELLEECNCWSLEIWVENVLASARFRRTTSTEENTLYCLDEDNDLISVTFPAILNLKGDYSRIRPFFSLENHEQVSFCCNFILLIIIFKKNFKKKTFDPSVIQTTIAIFQLLPLSYGYYDNIPLKAFEWSRLAMKMVQSLYSENERKLQYREPHFSFFILFYISILTSLIEFGTSDIGSSTPFSRIDRATDESFFIINSKPLFRDRFFIGMLI